MAIAETKTYASKRVVITVEKLALESDDPYEDMPALECDYPDEEMPALERNYSNKTTSVAGVNLQNYKSKNHSRILVPLYNDFITMFTGGTLPEDHFVKTTCAIKYGHDFLYKTCSSCVVNGYHVEYSGCDEGDAWPCSHASSVKREREGAKTATGI